MKTTTLLFAASLAGASVLPRQEDSVFEVSNFRAAANFKSWMEYAGDVQFGPYAGHCNMTTSDYTQCADASGIKDFPVWACTGGGDFFWQLNQAGGGSGSGIDGWNLELTALGVNGDAGPPLYGCQYFPSSAVKCNNTVFEPDPQYPAAYLDVPASFTMQFQTTSGCSYDYFTSTRSVPAPTGTPQATPTPA